MSITGAATTTVSIAGHNTSRISNTSNTSNTSGINTSSISKTSSISPITNTAIVRPSLSPTMAIVQAVASLSNVKLAAAINGKDVGEPVHASSRFRGANFSPRPATEEMPACGGRG